jgi:hypothetical protein
LSCCVIPIPLPPPPCGEPAGYWRRKDNSETLKYQLGDTDVDPAIRKTGQLDAGDPRAKAIVALLGGKIVATDDPAATTVGLRELPYDPGRFVGWLTRNHSGGADERQATLAVGLFAKHPTDSTAIDPIGKPLLASSAMQATR